MAHRRPSTLAVTSCELERSISHLRILKTGPRSTMIETCLNGLALLYTHNQTLHVMLQLLSTSMLEDTQLRRLQLVNPFTDVAD